MKTNSCVTTINPEQAYQMLIKMPYENQRSIKKRRLENYTTDMRNGKWEGGTSIRIGVVNSVEYLIDGQHRLQAIIESGTTQEFVLVRQLFADMDSLGKAYYRIDSGVRRSARDAFKSTNFRENSNLSDHQISKLSGGVNMIMSNWTGKSISLTNDDLLKLMEEWKSPMQVYAQAIAQGQRSIQDVLYNASCVAIGLYTCKYQPEKATQFWNSIANNNGLRAGTPEHTLLKLLMDRHATTMGRGIYVRKVANAWNAYYKGRSLTVLSVRNPDSDFDLEGTPLYAKGGGK